MFVDARTLPEGTRLEADLCVIGAGAAGITLARELAGGPLRVILLESGGFTMDPDAQGLAGGEVAGLPYMPLAGTRLRYFGGTTNHWGAVCRPFAQRDFEPEAHTPMSGWPIGLADLQPYYRRAGDVCGLAGFDELFKPASEQTFPKGLAEAFEPHFVERVPTSRRRFAPNYRAELARARNVTVYLHANVLEIEADEAVRRVVGVRATTFARNGFTVAARGFVLAAGGIENARLLLLSRSRRPAGLGNEHDLVGRYFLEHPRFVAATLLPNARALPSRMFEWRRVRRATIQTYLRLTPAVRRREGIGQVLVRLEPVYAFGSDIQQSAAVRSLRSLVKSPMGDDFSRDLATVLDDLTTWQHATIPGAPIPVPRPEVVREALRSPGTIKTRLPQLTGNIPTFVHSKLGGSLPVERMRVTTIIVPDPNPDSRVTLCPDSDALGQPRSRLDWRLGASDHRSARRTIEILAAEVGRCGAGRVKLLLEQDDQAWPEDLRGGFHHMGTTRMSDDPRQGVVDRRCRVHGLANLFVAGSSVFPTAGSGTPTLALVALTLRLAHHLKRSFA